MAKFKDREAKEAPYMLHNKDFSSVCSGSFYIKGRNVHEPCKNCDKCQKYERYKDRKEDTPLVRFRYVDSFRECDLWKYKAIDGAYALQIAIYNMVYVNDLACACIIDMKDKVKYQDKETQKIYRALLKREYNYEKRLTEILGDSIGFCAEYNSEMDDVVKDKICNLYDSIYNFLKKNGVDNSAFLAHAELAYIIIGYSILSIDKRIEECRKYNEEVVNLRGYKLTEMGIISDNLCKWLGRKCKCVVNLNKDKEIKDAYNELDKVLTNCSVIENSLIKAREKYVV